MKLFRPFIERRPWAAVLVSVVLGSPFGFFYLNRGRMGLFYLGLLLFVVIAPYVAFHYGYTDQAFINAVDLGTIGFVLISATHVFFAARKFGRERPLRWYARGRGLALMLLIPVLLILTFRQFVYEPFNVPSISMQPTLPVHSYFFGDKSAYGYYVPFTDIKFFSKSPAQGDVVVFRHYFENCSSITFVKRVVGLPGDQMQVKDGLLQVNGQAVKREKIEENYDPPDDDDLEGLQNRYTIYRETLPNGRNHLILEESDHETLDNTVVYTVPEGHYFLMGDNRDNSQDSRVQDQLGFVPESRIYGKAAFIFWNEQTYKFSNTPVE